MVNEFGETLKEFSLVEESESPLLTASISYFPDAMLNELLVAVSNTVIRFPSRETRIETSSSLELMTISPWSVAIRTIWGANKQPKNPSSNSPTSVAHLIQLPPEGLACFTGARELESKPCFIDEASAEPALAALA